MFVIIYLKKWLTRNLMTNYLSIKRKQISPIEIFMIKSIEIVNIEKVNTSYNLYIQPTFTPNLS